MCKHFQLTCVEIRFCCKLQQFCCSYYSSFRYQRYANITVLYVFGFSHVPRRYAELSLFAYLYFAGTIGPYQTQGIQTVINPKLLILTPVGQLGEYVLQWAWCRERLEPSQGAVPTSCADEPKRSVFT